METDKIGTMKSVNTDMEDIKFMTVRVNLSRKEKEEAKKLARSKGMFFSGWLEQLIKRELEASSGK